MAVDTEVAQSVSALGLVRWRPSVAGWAARFSVLGALLAALLLLVAVIPEFQANRIAFAAIFAIVGLSMNVLMGYGGQISLGHQAFVGIGAFTSGYIVTNMGLPFPIALVGAALSGGVSALILGGVALRIRGLYLALVTLAYGAVAERTIFLFRPLTGGGAGLPAPRPSFAEGDTPYAYFCLAMLALVLFFDWRLMKSKAGRAVQAIRDSERVAASMGINVMGYKLLGFVVSGLIAGLAGGLLAHHALFIVAAPFNFFLALEFVLMTVVGGLGSRVGVVLGSVFFALLDKFIPSDYALWVPAIGAGLLIITLIQFPGGIGQQIRPITGWFAGRKFDLHSIKEGASATAAGGGQDVRP